MRDLSRPGLVPRPGWRRREATSDHAVTTRRSVRIAVPHQGAQRHVRARAVPARRGRAWTRRSAARALGRRPDRWPAPQGRARKGWADRTGVREVRAGDRARATFTIVA